MGGDRFGPHTRTVESFIDRLRSLTPAQWRTVSDLSPGGGALPELEVAADPEYFQAVQEAAQAAKRNAFPGSETAFYDAMRTARAAAEDAIRSFTDPPQVDEPLREVALRRTPEQDEHALLQAVEEAYGTEEWQAAINAAMIAAGALVLHDGMSGGAFTALYRPVDGVLPASALR